MSVIGSASGYTDVTRGAHTSLLFCEDPPLLLLLTSASLVDGCVIRQFIVLNLVVVSLCVDS